MLVTSQPGEGLLVPFCDDCVTVTQSVIICAFKAACKPSGWLRSTGHVLLRAAIKEITEKLLKLLWMKLKLTPEVQTVFTPPHLQVASSPTKETSASVSIKELIRNGINAQVFL